MKRDITKRADIEIFIVNFYENVKADATIGFIFNDVVQMNWEKHIPVIVDFWETILLDNPVYTNNAMEVHYVLNKKIPLVLALGGHLKNTIALSVEDNVVLSQHNGDLEDAESFNVFEKPTSPNL